MFQGPANDVLLIALQKMRTAGFDLAIAENATAAGDCPAAREVMAVRLTMAANQIEEAIRLVTGLAASHLPAASDDDTIIV